MNKMEQQNLATLVQMFTGREQHVGNIEEANQVISNIDQRFDKYRDLLMLDLEFTEWKVKGRTYFTGLPYLVKNYHDEWQPPHQPVKHVLQLDSDNIRLWEVPESQTNDFKRYLKEEGKFEMSYYGIGLILGICSGMGLGMYFGMQVDVPEVPTLGFLAAMGITMADTVALGYIGSKLDDVRERKINERREKYAPIATGVDALEKVVEAYNPKS